MNNLIKIKDSMKKIEIFDPAMCCPTGLCGTNINPELMRVAVVVETLKRQGVIVTRHNLRDEPQVYVSNKTVNEYLQKNGAEALNRPGDGLTSPPELVGIWRISPIAKEIYCRQTVCGRLHAS